MTRVLRNAPAPAQVVEEDLAAVKRLTGGELSALGELYERHHHAVYAFVCRATSGGSDASDIVQDTFMTVAKIAANFDGESPFRPWLLGIAARLVLRRSRSFGRLGRMLGRFAEEIGFSETKSIDPEHQMSLQDDRTVLISALGSLSEAKRIVVVMAEIEGMTCEEIASALEIPVGTVWTRLHHARQELRACLTKRGTK